jgi:hypothetical protein
MEKIEEKIVQLQSLSKRLVTIEFDGGNFVIKDDKEIIATDDVLVPALDAAIKFFANNLRASIERVISDISFKETELQHKKDQLLVLKSLLSSIEV